MRTILVVDDDLNFRQFLSVFLSSSGFRVVEATGGDHALRLLGVGTAASLVPDLILTDFEMGAMGGYELIRRVRSAEPLRTTPIVMISGTSKDVDAIVMMEGIEFVRKPCSAEEVLRVVRKYVPEQAGGAPEPPAAPSKETGSEPALVDVGHQRAIAGAADLVHLMEKESRSASPEAGPAEHAAETSPAVKLLDMILAEAVRIRASDIHMEPYEGGFRIRFRIDGALHPIFEVPPSVQRKIVGRIKVLADLDIAESRLPQDGRFTFRQQEDQPIELRVSTLPAQRGEKIVLRVLRSGKIETELSDVFKRPRDLKCVEAALSSPVGLILSTGPTGGGKTTTLYSMLRSVNDTKRNIVTVEDPVEYELPGVTQVAVKPSIGLTFERVLRACLRQDPNVLLVGEIRDNETGEMAMKAGMTGHLVLSTLHTNYAPLACFRLATMGIKPDLIAAALRLVVAQRLIRVLCPKCKVQGRPDPRDERQLRSEEAARLRTVYLPKGCSECRGIGYIGRRAVVEVMPVESHEMRELIVGCASPDIIRGQAAVEGMRTLREGALELVEEGVTSLAEAMTIYQA